MIASSTCAGSIPARRTDSATTFAPSSGAVSGESPPINFPIGARTALNSTGFSTVESPSEGYRQKFQYRRGGRGGQFERGIADRHAKKGPPPPTGVCHYSH